MKYSLKCKQLGTSDCEEIIALEGDPRIFAATVFRHLELKHRPFLSDFYAKDGLNELHRLIAGSVDRNK